MIIDVLYSGSDGNACRVFTDKTSILIDCGVTRSRLFENGRFPLDAVFVTHSHHDHLNGIEVLTKRERIPVYMEEELYRHKQDRIPTYLAKSQVHFSRSGKSISIGDLTVHPFASSHDGVGGLNFIVEEKSSGRRFAHVTDTGVVTDELVTGLKSCHGLLLEANHDTEMLRDFPGYPQFLKQRIRSDVGHLSNRQSFDLIENHLDLTAIKWIIFGHLSKKTNRPELVMDQARERFNGYASFYIAPVRLEV